MSAAICASCRVTRPAGALLAVTDAASGRRRFVCRPLRGPDGRESDCFRREVRWRGLDLIDAAGGSDEANLLEAMAS